MDSNVFRDEARKLRKEVIHENRSLRSAVGEHGMVPLTFIQALRLDMKARRTVMLEIVTYQQRKRARELAKLIGGKKKKR